MNFQDNFLENQRKYNQKDFKLLKNLCKWKLLVKYNLVSNGIMSLPYEHPSLENFKKEKQKNRSTHKPIQKKIWFSKTRI